MDDVKINIELNQQIGEALMDKFGYSRVQKANEKTVQVQGFEVLSTKQKKPYMKKEIEQIEASLSSNQVQKQFFADYSKLVLKKLKEYNRIVTYKHIIDKRKVDQLEQHELHQSESKGNQQTASSILRKIQITKQELLKKQNLSDHLKQFALNRRLNGYYKLYQGLENNHHRKRIFSENHVGQAINNLSKTDPVNQTPISQLKKSVDISTDTRSFSTKEPKIVYHYKLQKNRMSKILQPYPEMELTTALNESKKIETRIENEHQIMQLWKMRVDEVRQAHQKKFQQKIKIKTNPTNRQQTSHSQHRNQLIQIYIDQKPKLLDYDNLTPIYSNSNDHRNKEQMFSRLIKKKNHRYIKHKGMKNLMEFNAEIAAKNLLQNHCDGYSVELPPIKYHMQKLTDYSDLAILEGPPLKVPLDGDYEAQYKNQKMNASLRARRH